MPSPFIPGLLVQSLLTYFDVNFKYYQEVRKTSSNPIHEAFPAVSLCFWIWLNLAVDLDCMAFLLKPALGRSPKEGASELNTEYLGLQDPVENSPFS